MKVLQKITPFLWFNDQAEEAVTFYISIFRNSKILKVVRYSEAGREHHRRPPGSAMTVAFELEGQTFTALNGGPVFEFSSAISFVIHCETQEEVDYYWEKLSAGGDEAAQQCGWLKDRYGVSWQVVPSLLIEMLADAESENSKRATEAMMRMKKLDIQALRNAYEG